MQHTQEHISRSQLQRRRRRPTQAQNQQHRKLQESSWPSLPSVLILASLWILIDNTRQVQALIPNQPQGNPVSTTAKSTASEVLFSAQPTVKTTSKSDKKRDKNHRILPEFPENNFPTPLDATKPLAKNDQQIGKSGSLPDRIPRLSELLNEPLETEQSWKPKRQQRRNKYRKNNSSHSTKSVSKTVSARKQTVLASSRKDEITYNATTTTSTFTPTKPWRANFQASIRTQGRIKKAFQMYRKGESPTRRAQAILQALWSTPAQYCNAANVIAALTFSAKALGTYRIQPDEQLRKLLFDTIGVLHSLVHDNVLTARQLCNACWAIAKHYDRDPSLLPPPPKQTALSSEDATGVAEEWYFSDSDKLEDPSYNRYRDEQQKVDETIDEIALQLAAIFQPLPSDINTLDPTPSLESTNNKTQGTAKIGEICMASWAYGKLRPRSTPPGWQIPPQLGRLHAEDRHEAQRMAHTTNMITFEQWGGSFGASSFNGGFNSGNEENAKNEEGYNHKAFDSDRPMDSEAITERLFDAIGAALTAPASGTLNSIGHTSDMDLEHTKMLLKDCTWSELANVGWSFASHGSCKSPEAQRLLLSLAREARYRLQQGGTATKGVLVRDIAQLLWALGTLQADNFRLANDLVYLVEALSTHLQLGIKAPTFGRGRPLQRWSCADLVQVALSLAHARIDEMPLLRAIYEESNHRLLEGLYDDHSHSSERRAFRPWEVTILLWAQARLHLKEEEGVGFDEFVEDSPKFFLKALRQSQRQNLQDIGVGPQEQANLVWSLTVLEKHQNKDAIDLIQKIFDESAATCREERTIQLEHAHQLWQAFFLLESESPEAVEGVPEWFIDYLQQKWTLEKARNKISSARHRSLSQTLQLMGVDHYNEHDEDIDVAIVLKGGASWTHETALDDEYSDFESDHVSVAVEFDGPNHFTRERDDRTEQPRALGHTVLKYRLLKKQGWSVVRVPYFEFDKIPFWASMERQRYLQRKLKTHSNLKFSDADVSEYSAIRPNRKSRFD